MRLVHLFSLSIFVLLILGRADVRGQINFEQRISVNEDGADPHPQAILDLSSSDKGILIPRMTTAQREAIGGTSGPNVKSPTSKNDETLEGLLVYDTDYQSFWFFDGGSWDEINPESVFREGTAVYFLGGNDFLFGRKDPPAVGQEISDSFLWFDQSEGAFRGGLLDQSERWSPDAIGLSSFAYGHNVEASGDYAVAIGEDIQALGNHSFAAGKGLIVSDSVTFAVGQYNVDIPYGLDPLFVVGNGDSTTSRSNAFTIAKNGQITGSGFGLFYIDDSRRNRNGPPVQGSIDTTSVLSFLSAPKEIGLQGFRGSLRTGLLVTSGGMGNFAWQTPGVATFTSGINTIATAKASTAMGTEVISACESCTTIGMWNDTTFAPDPNNQPLFVIGNGGSDMTRSNVFVVSQDSTMQLGSTVIRDTFDVSKSESRLIVGANVIADTDNKYNLGGSNFRWKKVFATNGTIQTSDIRAKKDISNLENGMDKIMSIRPVSYRWNADAADDKKTLGVIAQELLSIVPEVVDEPDNTEDLYGVNYSELIPLLIKGMQEQQEMIKKLEGRLALFEQLVAEK